MKKIIPLLTAIGLALSFGLAYADESATMYESGKVLSNGITVFLPVLQQCSVEGGAGAGGVDPFEATNKAILNNGITHYDMSTGFSGAKCSWAGGPGIAKEMRVDNGITGGLVR